MQRAGQRPPQPESLALNSLKQQLLKLGSMVEESAVLARSVLAIADMEAAPQIRRSDDQIDILYHQLESNCTQLLTEKVLPQQQVREVLSYIHCVRDLERIGDYCKELASLGERLLPSQPLPQRDSILKMLDRCRSLLALALDCVSEDDSSAGARLQNFDDLVDNDYERLLEQLMEPMPTTPEAFEASILLVLVLRCIERMADHAVNVSQRVARVRE
jgi:phosphate transport system protein